MQNKETGKRSRHGRKPVKSCLHNLVPEPGIEPGTLDSCASDPSKNSSGKEEKSTQNQESTERVLYKTLH